MLSRLFGRLFFFGAPFFLLAVGVVAASMNGVFGPFEPETLDRMTLIRLMQLRDFRTFSPELLRRTTNRADAEFGRQSSRPPIFEFTLLEKKIYAYFRGQKSASKSCMETNLMLMARIRYFQWMNDHESLTGDERRAVMNGALDDMEYWQNVYFDFLRAAELPIPSLAELIQEFDEMIEGFKIDATAEEIARIDSFKQSLNRAFVSRGLQGAVQSLSTIPGNVTSAVSNVFGAFLKVPEKKPEKKNDPASATQEKE